MKKKKINFFWILINIAFTIFIIDMVRNTVKIRNDISRLKKEKGKEEEDIEVLSEKKNELQYQINNMDTEKIAREKLNMVKDGEKIYIILD